MATVSMPQLGESVTEGTVGRWLKQPGETVEKYEPLVEVTTDKVNAEVPSPFSGVLQEIMVQEGETVHVGTQLAVIADESETGAVPPPHADTVRNQAGGEAAGPLDVVASTAEPSEPTSASVSSASAVAAEPNVGSATAGAGTTGADADADSEGRRDRRRFTPLVLRLADQHNIPLDELSRIPGTGLGGRIGKNDVLTYIETRRATPAPAQPQPRAAAPAAPSPTAQPATPSPLLAASAPPAPLAAGAVVPLTPMRKAIAEHMVRSLATTPHAWTMVEVDMTALARYRAARKDEFARREGFALSYVPFFIEAVVGALKAFPALNASFTDAGIELKREINIGVAVALEHQQGLVVPVLKRADERNLVGLARAVNDLVTRARAGKLTVDDLQGGTFTVNNPGAFGSILSQPIINQPQAAIVTMEAIVKRPVVVSDGDTDMIAIRQLMNMCISFDHRVLDGLTAGQFLADLKRRLEQFGGSPGL